MLLQLPHTSRQQTPTPIYMHMQASGLPHHCVIVKLSAYCSSWTCRPSLAVLSPPVHSYPSLTPASPPPSSSPVTKRPQNPVKSYGVPCNLTQRDPRRTPSRIKTTSAYWEPVAKVRIGFWWQVLCALN